jgi:NAD(P)-dependent dehydrogenase (short-subunit alcohol dehydrogenase family)
VIEQLSVKYPQTTFHALQSDISKEDSVQSVFRKINKIGSLDILVANAAYLPNMAPLATSETADWWLAFQINTLGTYLLAKAFVNQSPKPPKTPVFIGINSGASHAGPILGPMSGYAASKLAAASVIEYLQSEHPEMKAFNVQPGVVKSDMHKKAGQESLQASDSPELVAHMAVWLAGPDSDFLKGRFIWANWDVEELVRGKDKITADPALFRLTWEGWNSGFAAFKAE